MVEYERLRVDRNGSCFAFLVLTPLDTEHLARDAAELATVLDGRLRLTDEFGWWDSRSIGVLLLDADETKARHVLRDLSRLLGGRIPLASSVCVYPPSLPTHPDVSQPGEEPAHEARYLGLGEVRCSAEDTRAATLLHEAWVRPLPAWKRGMDICGAVLGLVALSPIWLLAALAVKLTSPGPLFFRQRRDGLGGKPFTMIKFRTMHVDAEARKAELRPLSEQDGPAFKLGADPRITRVGRYLRRTCIDELPQLWQVLRGEMTLVGPRPLDSEEAKHFTAWQRRRQDVTPGMTCTWQARGGLCVSFNEWMRMDLRYMRRRTLWHDLRLIWATFVAVLRNRASK
jgi:lipopolysaccharide/colanic/teichoic acid biosynthesis glycosyltransferase